MTDFMFRWRGPVPTSNRVVIVDIDERSLRNIGQWPWPRNILAELTKKIHEKGAIAIGFDMVFAEQDRTSPKVVIDKLEHSLQLKFSEEDLNLLPNNETYNYDLALGIAVARAPTVLGYVFQMRNDGTKRQGEVPFPTCQIKISPDKTLFKDLAAIPAYRAIVNVAEVAQGETEGFFNVFTDPSGTVRNVPLIMLMDNIPYPSLALEMFRIGQNKRGLTIHASRQVKTPATGILGISVGGHFIPTDDKAQFNINFRGPARTFPYVSAVDILEGHHPTSMNNKYVLIGTSAAGLFDLKTTPFSASFPGAEVQASIIDNMIAGDPFTHDQFTEIGLTYTLIVLGGVLLSALLAYTGPLTGGLGGLLFILVTFVGNFHFFFTQNRLLGTVYPLFSFIVIFLIVTLFNYFFEGRERRFIQGAFGRYVSPQIVSQLLKSPERLSLKGEQKNLTVLFSDIRGFTSISEEMDSEALGLFMNEYLTSMSKVVMAYGGTVDKFIGDAVMAIWGAPHDDDAHAVHAVRAALVMMDTLKAAQQNWSARGLPVIDIGIGINTGTMSVGNFGSRDRFDYTVMGDNVNLASRLEGVNKDYGTNIIISEHTKNALKGRFYCRYIDKVRVKGKHDSVMIYEPLMEGKPDAVLRIEVESFEKAVKDYQARRFSEALEALEMLYQANPLRLYAVYVHRIKGFIKTPPPEHWDGVERRAHLPSDLGLEDVAR